MSAVLLLDTYSLFFRAYHALPAMTTSRGEPTSALYGTSALLLKLLREQEPKGLAFAVDAPGPTFRHALFEPYKAHRERPPDPLLEQFRRLDELLEALGVPVFQVQGFEADDVLATLARELSITERVRIVSGDRDLFQTVGPNVEVLFIGRRGRDPACYDERSLGERFGIEPHALPSWTALVGDPSDGIPGTPGIGPRTASKLVARHGSIRGLLDALDEVQPARLREALRAAQADLLRNEQLARLNSDVPLPPGPRYGSVTIEAFERVRALFTDLEFKSLLPRLDALPRA